MTEVEQLLWEALRANRLRGLHFRRQQIFHGFIVDFYCHAARLVVEVEADHEREQILTGRDLHVLRVTNDELKQDLRGVLNRLWVAARARARLPIASPFPRGEGG